MVESNSYAVWSGALYPAVGDVVNTAPTYGDAINVLNGTLDVTGNPPVFPPEGDVRLGISYGTTAQPTLYTGNVRVPPASRVELGYAYDSNDSVIGQLVAGDLPDVEDVRFGVNFGDQGASVGVLQVPAESQVLVGVGYGAYGTEFTGTLVDVPGGTGSIFPPVNIDGSLRSPLIIGDDYVGERAFSWDISPISGMDLGTATIKFRGWKACCNCCPDTYDWDVEGTLSGDATTWNLLFDMASEISETIEPGSYDWAVTIEDGGVLFTITGSFEHPEVDWSC